MANHTTELADTDARVETLAGLLNRLQDIPAERVRMRPYPGTATEQDVIEAVESKYGRACELVDGVLVEKAMGYYESRLAFVLIGFLDSYLREHDQGIGLAPDAMIRTEPGRVRLPDVSFFLWDRFPGKVLPAGQILNLVPDFAVEILSPANTRREMERKRGEYFAGGARLVWEVEPAARAVNVYTGVDQFKRVGEDGILDGGTVLPGFALPVRSWFERAGRRAEGP